MAVSKKTDLGTGSVAGLIVRLSVPAIVAQLINVLYNIVDRIYIGHIPVVGTAALTGVGVTFPILTLISAFSYFVGSGGAPQAAISMGRGDNDYAEKILGNCFASLIFISVILTVFILIFKRNILMAFGASQNTIDYAVSYISIYACGTFFVQLVLGLNTFISCQGFASVAMRTTVIGAVLNLILDPVFIFAFNMGVKGAALATVISQAVSCVWVLKFLTGNKSVLRLRKKYIHFDKKIVLSVTALGVSPFIMQSTESILSVCFNSSLQFYGQDLAVGAMTILSSVMQFALLPIMGICQGGQPIISFNYGAEKTDRVKKAFKIIFACCTGYTCLMWLAVFINPHIFASIFTSDEILISFASWAVKIYMGATLLMGMQISCQQTFVALNQPKISLFLAVLRKIVLLIPMVFILPRILPESFCMNFVPLEFTSLMSEPAKVFAVFLAEPVSDFIAILTTVTVFSLNFNKILNIKK